jgi:hypothetical protein
VAVDPRKVSPRPSMPYTSTPCGLATPLNGLTAVSGVAPLETGRLVAVFYDFEHPTLYAYASFSR